LRGKKLKDVQDEGLKYVAPPSTKMQQQQDEKPRYGDTREAKFNTDKCKEAF
jgi:hypothetical protein